MFCSMCSASLASNSDNNICKFGHFLCTECSSSSPNQKCLKCENRIQHISEAIGSSFPTIIFERNLNGIVSNFEPDLSQIYPDLESESNSVNHLPEDDIMDYIGAHQSKKKNFFGEHNAEYVKENFLDFSRKIASPNENLKSCVLGRVPSKSACRFTAPSDGDFLKYYPKPPGDPKKNYLKTMSGEASDIFDPMKDFFERIAKVNELHDYQNRPNLYIAAKIKNGEDRKVDDTELVSKENCRNYENGGSTDTERSSEKVNPDGSIKSDSTIGMKQNFEFGSEGNILIRSKPNLGASELINGISVNEHNNQEKENSLRNIFESNLNVINGCEQYQELEQDRRNSTKEKLTEEIYSQFKTKNKARLNNDQHKHTPRTLSDAGECEEIKVDSNRSIYKSKNILYENLKNQQYNKNFIDPLSTYDSELRTHVDPKQKKYLKKNNSTFEPTEMHADAMKFEPITTPVYYVQLSPGQESLSTKKTQLFEEFEYNADQMKNLAANLVKDFREEPLKGEDSHIDIRRFIKFLREKFPNITKKNLNDILSNLPHDYKEFDNPEVIYNGPSISTEKPSTPAQMTSTSAMRAYFNINHRDTPNCEPLPKFQLVHNFDLNMEHRNASKFEISPATNLNIPRSPVKCPITSCSKLTFVSEFAKHIKVDHTKMPIETMMPGKHKNLFLDPRANRCGHNKSHLMYLVINKITNLGSNEYKDYLPILLMSMKVNSVELLCSGIESSCQDDQCLVIWLTGLKPIDLPIFYSLTAWSSRGPGCHVVHSGSLYSIRNDQDCRSLFDSGQMLLLSNKQCDSLTDNGRNFIELQVIVH